MCPEATFWFFSFIHVILKKYLNHKMQDQAAIGFLQFVDVQLDLGFWISLISNFGLIWRLKIYFPLLGTPNNLTPPSGTVCALTKYEAIAVVIFTREWIILDNPMDITPAMWRIKKLILGFAQMIAQIQYRLNQKMYPRSHMLFCTTEYLVNK